MVTASSGAAITDRMGAAIILGLRAIILTGFDFFRYDTALLARVDSGLFCLGVRNPQPP